MASDSLRKMVERKVTPKWSSVERVHSTIYFWLTRVTAGSAGIKDSIEEPSQMYFLIHFNC